MYDSTCLLNVQGPSSQQHRGRCKACSDHQGPVPQSSESCHTGKIMQRLLLQTMLYKLSCMVLNYSGIKIYIAGYSFLRSNFFCWWWGQFSCLVQELMKLDHSLVPGHSHVFSVAHRATLKTWEWPGDEANWTPLLYII